MKEPSTYRAIIREGQVRALKEILLELGTQRFGPPAEGIRKTIKATSRPNPLKKLYRQLLDVSSWEELLTTAGGTPRPRQRKKKS